MVIIAENGIGDPRSNLSLFCCVQFRTNVLLKGMDAFLIYGEP